MRPDESLEVMLVDELTNDDIKELTTDYMEVGLDFFINNDTLKEIPVFGTLYKVYKVAANIREQIFLKKLYAFLFHLKDIPTTKRKKLIDKIEHSKKEKHQLGLKLIMLIDKLDDIEKPKIISELFRASIEEKIDHAQFLTLSNIVSNTYIGDLKDLKANQTFPMSQKERLYNNGLMGLVIKKGTVAENTKSDNNQQGKQITIEVESETRKLYNDFQDGKSSVKEIKDKIALEIDFEINELGQILIKFGLGAV